MKYIAYNRKSTDEANNQVQSLDTQKRITDDVAKRAGLEVLETYQEAISARKPGKRPLFSLMLERVRKGEAQGIIVAHIDRLSRNGQEAAQITQLFEEGKLKEIRTGSKTYNSVEDILYMDFDFVFASHFSRALSKRVKEGMETKRQRGEYPSIAPIGYRNIKGGIEPDPKYSGYIQFIFTQYATGQYPLKKLTQIMYEKGMRTRKSGTKVYMSVIHEILVNPAYYGMIKGKERLYKGNHTPLISKSLYDQVQQLLHGKNKTRPHTLSFLYRGYLTCGNCGCCMTATLKKKRYVYYYCTNGKGNCTQHLRYLPEADIYTLLRDQFGAFSSLQSRDSLEALRVYSEDLRSTTDSTQHFREQMDSRLQEIEKELLDLVRQKIKGRVSEDQFVQLEKELTDEKNNLELQIRNVKPQDPEVTLELLEKIKSKALTFQMLFEDDDEDVRGDLLKSVLWNSSIVDGKITSQQYKKPWFYMQKPLETNDFRDWYP